MLKEKAPAQNLVRLNTMTISWIKTPCQPKVLKKVAIYCCSNFSTFPALNGTNFTLQGAKKCYGREPGKHAA